MDGSKLVKGDRIVDEQNATAHEHPNADLDNDQG